MCCRNEFSNGSQAEKFTFCGQLNEYTQKLFAQKENERHIDTDREHGINKNIHHKRITKSEGKFVKNFMISYSFQFLGFLPSSSTDATALLSSRLPSVHCFISQSNLFDKCWQSCFVCVLFFSLCFSPSLTPYPVTLDSIFPHYSTACFFQIVISLM